LEVAVIDPKWIKADRKAVDAYFRKLEGPVQAMAKTLDRIVREEAPDSKLGIKWSVPFYFRDAGPLADVSGAKRHVTSGVARGAELKDTKGMLRSTGRTPIGSATFPISEPVPEKTVRRWLREASGASAEA
jgi:hypothetical protein